MDLFVLSCFLVHVGALVAVPGHHQDLGALRSASSTSWSQIVPGRPLSPTWFEPGRRLSPTCFSLGRRQTVHPRRLLRSLRPHHIMAYGQASQGCMCMRARMRACVCAVGRVCMCVCTTVGVCMRASTRAYVHTHHRAGSCQFRIEAALCYLGRREAATTPAGTSNISCTFFLLERRPRR